MTHRLQRTGKQGYTERNMQQQFKINKQLENLCHIKPSQGCPSLYIQRCNSMLNTFDKQKNPLMF